LAYLLGHHQYVYHGKPQINLLLLKFVYWLNYQQEVITLKKTLNGGMFSSVSDAELVTQMLTEINDEDDVKPKDSIKSEAEKVDNWLPNL
jgi:hypothetical protein